MSSGIGKEGSQEGASCAQCELILEKKGNKKEQFVPHVELILERKGHKREQLVPHASSFWKRSVTLESHDALYHPKLKKKGYNTTRESNTSQPAQNHPVDKIF
ncbi:hypothetical protein ACM26V_16065 [Salipaludibacillus sp. HK11]|uniref:hypothetical protein n=1 Tax=Salipaludibacillus sp. HK11 TaxID=3394320 RepID=UPI0039FDC46D